jgi:hypothetical protein
MVGAMLKLSVPTLLVAELVLASLVILVMDKSAWCSSALLALPVKVQTVLQTLTLMATQTLN